METQDIDFELIQVIKGSPSKKYLKKILEYCFMIRNKIYSFEQYYQTPVALQFHQDLNLTESQSHKFLISMVKLIELAAQNCFSELQNIFPDNFDEQLKELLTELLQNYGPEWSTAINTRICQADRLLDIDWRLDVQVATHDQVKTKNPIVYMQLETSTSQKNESRSLTFQMNTTELNSFHTHLTKIKDQLQTLAHKNDEQQ